MKKSAIKLKNISKFFPNGKKANNKINLELKYGEIYALLGENGAGKSTLIKIICGELRKTSGIIEIDGNNIPIHNTIIANSYKIGVVHQHFSLIKDFSIYKNVILGSEFKNKKEIEKLEKKFNKKLQIIEKLFNQKKFSNSEKKNLEIFKKKVLKLTISWNKQKISFLNLNKENFIELEKLIKKYDLNIFLKKKIKDVSIGEQQKTEILRLLFKKSKIVIFDEPTSVLTLEEIDQFLLMLKEFKKAGKAILFITHKIEEIKKIADKVSIIRNGKIISTYNVEEISVKKMISEMVEGEQIFDVKKFKRNKVLNENILTIKNLNLFSQNKKETLHDININIKKGEIVGIAGIEENGQRNLLEVISGMEKRINGNIQFKTDSNSFLIDVNFKNKNKFWNYFNFFKKNKTKWTDYNVQSLRKNGILYIPKDRLHESLLHDEPLYINYCFNSLENKDYFSGFLNYIEIQKIKLITKNMCIKYNVQGITDLDDPISFLSGGNQQKFVIGRELMNKPKLLLIDQPTWGIDEKSIGVIYEQFIKLRNLGKSILFSSTDLKEILTLSDRVLVMSKGRIVGEVDTSMKNSLNKISELITKTI